MSSIDSQHTRHFVLNDLMAGFPVHARTHSEDGFVCVSSNEVEVSDYLAASGEYAGLTLRPVLVRREGARPLVPDVSLLGNGVIARFSEAFYHVEITAHDIGHFILCDALHAAMSLSMPPPDVDFLLMIESMRKSFATPGNG